MRESGVVLAEQILAIVVAVWRPHHRVDVGPRWLVVVQRDSAQVIKLDQQHRTMDAVIKDTLVHAAGPRHMRAIQLLLDFSHAHAIVASHHAPDVHIDQLQEQRLLSRREHGRRQAFVRQLQIVPQRTALNAALVDVRVLHRTHTSGLALRL